MSNWIRREMMAAKTERLIEELRSSGVTDSARRGRPRPNEVNAADARAVLAAVDPAVPLPRLSPAALSKFKAAWGAEIEKEQSNGDK
jgi:hypothetical protein